MANYARSESEITSFDKNSVFGSQYIILWNENTQTEWTKFNISEFGIFPYYFYIVCHTNLIDDHIECPKTKSHILFYSNDNNKISTTKVDQFFHFSNGMANEIFLFEKMLNFYNKYKCFKSHITVYRIFNYIQIWVLTYLKTDGFIFLRIMTIFTTRRLFSRNCICFCVET